MPYKNTLYINNLPDSERKENGDFISSESENWILVSECDEIPSDKGRTITGADGVNHVYQSILLTPEDCPTTYPDTPIKVVSEDGETILEGTVKRFKSYNQNCKIWV